MKKARRWIARILVFVMILTSVPMYPKKEVKAAGGVYSKLISLKSRFPDGAFWNHRVTNYNNNGDQLMKRRDESFSNSVTSLTCATHTGTAGVGSYDCNYFDGGIQCMGFAKKIFYEVFGQRESSLPRRTDVANVAVGDYVRVNKDGHSGVILSRNGNTIKLAECNLCGSIVGNTVQYPSEKCRIGWGRINYSINSITYFKRATNYAQVDGGSAPAPQPVTANASVKATSCDKYDTNLVPRAKVYNPNKKRITTVGIQIKDGNNVIGKKEETMVAYAQYYTSANVWFDCNKELGVRLRPGHVYSWEIYADVDGKRFYTGWINDRTTGTEKPNTPAFTTSKKDYAVGDAVTVSWGADSNATKGYSLTITQTKGGSYTKTLTTNTANATSLAFALPNEGEYKITGYARGSVNSDVATLNKTIVAHKPSKVRFVEYDKEGKENLLCEQTVRYGYAATAPTGISRKGHTFIGWKGEYSNVTSDRTIEAQFKRNTYRIVFCDKDGKTIKTESVLFEDNATAPEPPEAEKGYVFAGWDSEDYKNVQGNATIKATYVWANNDLPVVITLNKCEFKDDGYIINYDIKNNPNKRTKGRALVSLKTSKGKLLDSTESKAFSLGKAEEKKNMEIYVPYEGTATKADLYIINGFSKGIPISEVASVDVERNWSEWDEEKPDDNNEIESRTEYRHQDQETTTTRMSSNPGWTLDKSVLDANWTYGGWSGWSRNSYGAYTNTTSKREVETKSVQDSAAYTLYNWYYYRYWNSSAGTYYYTYSSSMGGTRYDWQTNYCLPQIGTYSGHAGYKPAGGKNFSNEIWFLASTQNVGAKSHTEWRYRDATKGYTYYWNRWKDWTSWSPTEVKESATRKVETRTTYRYRAKMEDIEDNSGKSYKVSGKLDSELAGKQATLLVYKNDEPSDSNNEYVGQMTIGEDGSYSYEFIPRQAISAKTGDYTVALAIEGAENPVFLETIVAPKPVYTVTFKDDDGNIIDEQEVTEGSSATSPKVPDKEHFYFVGWDYGFTNVRDNMEITAQYVKNKYSVAYVNWETKEAETKVFSYGDALDYPDETQIEGYDFVGWTTLDGEKVTEVTDNLVLQANYKIKSYTINFYDKAERLVDTQIIEYGQDAKEPEHEEIDKMNFVGWNTYGFIQVKSNLDVYPVYEWKETTANPSCDTESGVFTEKTKVHLSAEDGATIYYTTDGTEPNEFSEKYSNELEIAKNTYLQFVAVSPEKNMSETMAVSFLVASGEDDEGALVVKKEKYKLDRGSDSKITYFLSHENPDIGVNFYSLNDDIATVEEDGTLHANNVGKTQIFISTKDNKYADYCEVEVTTTDIDVESIDLDKTSVVGIKGEKIQVNASVYPENATEKGVDWYTDDESIASVSESGEVTINKKGVTVLRAYAKSGSCIAECQINGISDYSESKIQMSVPYLFLYENDVDYLYVYYDDAEVNCTWESSNTDVATVEDGIVTAKKAGMSVITATSEDGTQVTNLVTVGKNPENSDEGGKAEATPSPAPSAEPSPTPTSKPTVTPKPTTKPTTKSTSSGNQSTVKKPKKISSLKVKASGKKKLKVSWKWIVSQDGFEVQYALNKKFTKSKKTKRYGSYTDVITLKNLKSKRNYYVRVRAYKLDGYKKVYGSWSTVKKCKTK